MHLEDPGFREDPFSEGGSYYPLDRGFAPGRRQLRVPLKEPYDVKPVTTKNTAATTAAAARMNIVA